jgi:hypothetical protein
MSQATPFLLSLGISKSRVALVLMAGPLSGMQSPISQLIINPIKPKKKNVAIMFLRVADS